MFKKSRLSLSPILILCFVGNAGNFGGNADCYHNYIITKQIFKGNPNKILDRYIVR